jgi:hypothetical protein
MVQKWNLAVQQQLGGDVALEVGYQGNHSSHQLLQPDFNQAPVEFTTANINGNSLRPYPDIGNISGTATFGVGNYDALTAKLEKRFSKGLQFIASYTYGHALSDTGTTLSGSVGFYTPNPLVTSSGYSSAPWDVRHNFTLGFTYDLPFGRGKQFGNNMNKLASTLIGNWQVNGILTLRTGNPYTIDANGCQDVNAGGCGPTLLSGSGADAAPSGGRTANEWFNIANYAAPGPLSLGNTGLQTNTAPPTRNMDLSVFKDFPLTERFKVQFRAETFNLANTPQFGYPGNTYGSSNFGQITSTATGSERHIQFSLRFQF